MRRFLVGTLAFIGFLALLAGLGVAGTIWWVVREARNAPVPEKTILRLTVHGNPSETGGGAGTVRRLLGGQQVTTLRDVVYALERGRTDPRVLGLVADLSDARPSLAAAQELRDAVQRFRDAGKLAVAFADSFGEGGRSGNAYYVAAAFDQIWIQPSGELGFTGVAIEHPFFADTLKMLGITPRFGQRHEYKGGIDMFVERQLTPAVKRQFQALLDDIADQMVQGVAAGRRLAPEAVRALIDRAPLFADEAKTAGLIDGIGYADEVSALVRRRTDAGARFLGYDSYLSRAGAPHQEGAKIALIYGVGPVVRGGDDDDDDGSPFGGADTLSADTVARAFRAAIADKEVRAILFRVDSPGGSYVASDTVWREVKRAREAGKPVVASMGGVAASGGYFVSMAADKIIADPGTLTGSIGVYSGKFVLSGLWDKLGISWDQVKVGANAGMMSANQDFTPEQWQRFNASLDRIYADFAGRVAKDRNLPDGQLDTVARGRVWTGRQAATVGLVDATGGFHDAIALTREVAKLEPDAPVNLEIFPPERSPLDRLLKLLGDLDKTAVSVRAMARVADVFAPLLDRIDTTTRGGELRTPIDLR